MNVSTFEVIFGVKMRQETDVEILDLLNAELQEKFSSDRDEIRSNAKIQIAKIQKENRDHHNKRCKNATVYKVGDLVVFFGYK